MTAVEMISKFYDVLENTNRAFSITKERPVVDVVLGYLNEAQINFFNERYLPGDILTNISTIKLLLQELVDLLVVEDYLLVDLGNYQRALDTALTGIFVEGTISIKHTLLSTEFFPSEIVPVTLDSIGKYLTNHINSPILLQPVIALGSTAKDTVVTPIIVIDYLTEIKDDAAGVVTITTVQKPSDISIDSTMTQNNCLLHERFHEGITRNAVELYLREKGAFANQQGGEA